MKLNRQTGDLFVIQGFMAALCLSNDVFGGVLFASTRFRVSALEVICFEGVLP